MNRRKFLSAGLKGAVVLSLVGCDSSEIRGDIGGVGPAGSSTAVSAGSATVSARRRETIFSLGSFEIDAELGEVSYINGGRVLWTSSGFNYPVAVAYNGSETFVVDKGDHEIALLDSEGQLLSVMGSSELQCPSDIALQEDTGHLFVSDSTAHAIRVFDRNGTMLRSFGEPGINAWELNGPRSLDFDPSGNLHVVDRGNRRVAIYSSNGEFKSHYGLAQLEGPCSVAVVGETVYVADCLNNAVFSYDLGGSFLDKLDPQLNGKPGSPIFLSANPQGELLITAVPTFQA